MEAKTWQASGTTAMTTDGVAATSIDRVGRSRATETANCQQQR